MAYTAAAQDTDEPIADTDFETVANQHNYGVVSGCGVTYDAADLTYDVAAGTILHNGILVAVAAQANAGTLIADSTNPRWAYIYLDSTGTEGLVHGTAAATPAKPELGDNVILAAVKIEAAQTIANNIAVKLDKRVMTHAPTVTKYKTATQVISATTTFADVAASSGSFAAAIAANEIIDIEGWIPCVMSTTGGVKFQFTGPAAPTGVNITGTQNLQVNVSTTDNISTPITTPFTAVTAFSSAFAAADSVATATSADAAKYNLNGPNVIYIKARIINGANAGTVTLQVAQNSAAGTTTLGIGSTMRIDRVG